MYCTAAPPTRPGKTGRTPSRGPRAKPRRWGASRPAAGAPYWRCIGRRPTHLRSPSRRGATPVVILKAVVAATVIVVMVSVVLRTCSGSLAGTTMSVPRVQWGRSYANRNGSGGNGRTMSGFMLKSPTMMTHPRTSTRKSTAACFCGIQSRKNKCTLANLG